MSIGIGSHTVLLSIAFQLTKEINNNNPVLELGAGLNSTLLLHGLCGYNNRKLVTLESNMDWLNTFNNLKRDWHEIKLVGNFKNLPEYNQEWSLALVDHGIAEQREDSAFALKNVPIVVCHDSCHYWLYGYDRAFKEYKYQYTWKSFQPYTTILSNTIDVESLLGERNL